MLTLVPVPGVVLHAAELDGRFVSNPYNQVGLWSQQADGLLWALETAYDLALRDVPASL
jgi:hypothetical protein